MTGARRLTSHYVSLRVWRSFECVCYNSDNHTQPGSSRLIWLVVDRQGGNRTNSANGYHRKRTRKLSNAVGTRGWLGWLVGWGGFWSVCQSLCRCHQKNLQWCACCCPAELSATEKSPVNSDDPPQFVRFVPWKLRQRRPDQVVRLFLLLYCILNSSSIFWGICFHFRFVFVLPFKPSTSTNLGQRNTLLP